MKLCNKNSRETSATFTLESVQIIGYIYLGLDFENLTTTLQCLPKIHFITIVNLQHCMLLFLTLQLYKVMYDVVDLLLHLVQAIAISTKNMMVYVGQVSLAIKFVKLVPIYRKGLSALPPSGLQSSCLGDNALLPLWKNALLPFKEECHAATSDNALLPRQLGSQHYSVWLLRGSSAWLLKGPLSLAPQNQDFQLGFQEGLSSFAAQARSRGQVQEHELFCWRECISRNVSFIQEDTCSFSNRNFVAFVYELRNFVVYASTR